MRDTLERRCRRFAAQKLREAQERQQRAARLDLEEYVDGLGWIPTRYEAGLFRRADVKPYDLDAVMAIVGDDDD